jgi:carbonic anhydrase
MTLKAMKKNIPLHYFFAFALFLYPSIKIFAHTEPTVSAKEALEKLKSGNDRFVHGNLRSVDFKSKRLKLADKQEPFAIILTCSDSRIPPELVFDQTLGDIFVVRVAGNIVDSAGLGSIEYAAEHLGSRLIVVLGHESCGAVKAALGSGTQPPNIQSIVNKIAPAVALARSEQLPESQLLNRAIEINVREQMHAITDRSDLLREMAKNKSLVVVGAEYQLGQGKVEWLEDK